MKAPTALAGQGKLKSHILHCFPLNRAGVALQGVMNRSVIGKAVVVT